MTTKSSVQRAVRTFLGLWLGPSGRGVRGEGSQRAHRRGRLVITGFVPLLLCTKPVRERESGMLFSTCLWPGVKFTKKKKKSEVDCLHSQCHGAYPRALAPWATFRPARAQPHQLWVPRNPTPRAARVHLLSTLSHVSPPLCASLCVWDAEKGFAVGFGFPGDAEGGAG